MQVFHLYLQTATNSKCRQIKVKKIEDIFWVENFDGFTKTKEKTKPNEFLCVEKHLFVKNSSKVSSPANVFLSVSLKFILLLISDRVCTQCWNGNWSSKMILRKNYEEKENSETFISLSYTFILLHRFRIVWDNPLRFQTLSFALHFQLETLFNFPFSFLHESARSETNSQLCRWYGFNFFILLIIRRDIL